MEDYKIVELYFKRDERALLETQTKYAKYLNSISYNVLKSRQDAEECVNDTYQKAWDSIPPNSPQKLSAYLGKIVRNLSISRLLYNKAQKRNKNLEVLLSEIEEFLPSESSDFVEQVALKELINVFLSRLEKIERVVFVRRYFYASSIKDISSDYGLKQGNVKVMLFRLRAKLKDHLQREGVSI
ncbi:MAG: RNA polymerase sigma factor [Clostridia bacterium]|nr:RNA polymerase sigma factor [Clostridia bacterium]